MEDLELESPLRRAKPKISNDGEWLPNGQAAKSRLNKSKLDTAQGQFVQVSKWVAWKLGKVVREVDLRGIAQHCWNCFAEVAKQLSERMAFLPVWGVAALG